MKNWHEVDTMDSTYISTQPSYSESSVPMKIVEKRNATKVVNNSSTIIPIIIADAKKDKKTFSAEDDDTRFGYSVNQIGPLCKTKSSTQYLLTSIAKGGPPQQTFNKNRKLQA